MLKNCWLCGPLISQADILEYMIMYLCSVHHHEIHPQKSQETESIISHTSKKKLLLCFNVSFVYSIMNQIILCACTIFWFS